MSQFKLMILVMGIVAEVGRYPDQEQARAAFSAQTDKGVSPGDLRIVEVKG